VGDSQEERSGPTTDRIQTEGVKVSLSNVRKYPGYLTGDSTVISTLLLLALPFSPVCSLIRFLNNQPRGVRDSPFGSFRGSNFVLSVEGVLDVEALAVEFDEDEDDDDDDDDGDTLDNGDFPGFLGFGAAIISSSGARGGTCAGLMSTLTGEEDTDWDNQ